MNFDRSITKETALELIVSFGVRPSGYGNLAEEIGVDVMCKEYGDDDDWVGLQSDDFETIRDGSEYKTFELWYPIKETKKKKI